MIHSDRDRLLLAVGVTLVFHAALFGGLAVAGFDFTPYPETSPVTVTLPDYQLPEVEPEPVEPDPVEPEPVEPEPAEIAPAEPAPEETELAPAEPEPEPAPATEGPATEQSPAPPAAPAPAPGADAPPGSFSTEDLPWLSENEAGRQGEQVPDDELFAIDEPDDVESELPSWVVEGEVSIRPESSLERGEQEALDELRQTVPGFSDRLAELTEALENPPQASSSDGDGASGDAEEGPDTASSTTELPGGGIEWVGTGSRRPIGEPTLPSLDAADFGGAVPAWVSYLIVFEVDENGLVVPGSLILRDASGYTRADQKVREAVSTWTFEPAPGAPPATAIATLRIAREDIQ